MMVQYVRWRAQATIKSYCSLMSVSDLRFIVEYHSVLLLATHNIQIYHAMIACMCQYETRWNYIVFQMFVSNLKFNVEYH